MKGFKPISAKDIRERLQFIFISRVAGVNLYYSHTASKQHAPGFWLVDENLIHKNEKEAEFLGVSEEDAAAIFNQRARETLEKNESA